MRCSGLIGVWTGGSELGRPRAARRAPDLASDRPHRGLGGAAAAAALAFVDLPAPGLDPSWRRASAHRSAGRIGGSRWVARRGE